MTAIAGIVSYRSDLPLETICASALSAQSAYGAGRPIVCLADEIAVGIDLFSSLPEDQFDRQPICDDRFVLIADVRLDNRDQIIAHAGLSEMQFAKRSDAAILLLAWKQWEAGCLDKIVGDFAFAVYDRNLRQLTLTRDCAGSKPLCYREDSECLRFASMPSGVAEPGRLKPDLAALSMRLSDSLPAGRTCFENISAVPPGELVRFSPAGMTRHRYWNPHRLYDRERTAEQSATELRDRLDNAVRATMRRRSSTIATHLSSGYDSSAVTGTAVRFINPGERLVALTSAPAPGFQPLQFRGRIADESATAASTAETLGIEHIIVRDSSPLLNAMRGHARFYQQPVSNIFNQGWWAQVARAAASTGADTILSASAGNFTISNGGLSVLPYWLRTGHWLHWLAEARTARRQNEVRWRGLMMASLGPWVPHWLAGRIESRFLGAPREAEIHFLRPEAAHHPTRISIEITGDPFSDRLTMIRSLDGGLHRAGLLAQTGIEERDPTADRRLVEYCLSMPPEHLLADGIYRPVARAAFADRIPAEVLEQRSRGYQGADWFARLSVTDMKAVMEEIAPSRAADLLDLAKMARAIGHWQNLDVSQSTYVARLGRSLTDALATGLFIAEAERDPASIGRAIVAKPLAEACFERRQGQ